jgi:hypothetical protein
MSEFSVNFITNYLHYFVFSANMTDNNKDGASGSKPFWQLSQEMEEEAHRGVDVEEADTDPDYGTNRDVGDDTNDGATGDDTTDGGNRRTGAQTCSTP